MCWKIFHAENALFSFTTDFGVFFAVRGHSNKALQKAKGALYEKFS